MAEKLLTEKEFTELTGLSRMTAKRHRDAKRLGFYKIGARVMYSQKHVDDFLARHERAPRERKGTQRAQAA